MNQRMFVRDRQTWFAYWMIGYFAFLQTVLGPLMPFLRSDLRLSYTVASLHFSAFALGSVVTGSVGLAGADRQSPAQAGSRLTGSDPRSHGSHHRRHWFLG